MDDAMTWIRDSAVKTYDFLTAPQRKKYTVGAAMLGSGAFSAYLVGRINGHHSLTDAMLSAPALCKVVSAALHPAFVMYAIDPVVKGASSDSRAQLYANGMNVVYNLAEGVTYIAAGAQHPGFSVLPFFGLSTTTTSLYAYAERRARAAHAGLASLLSARRATGGLEGQVNGD